MPSPAVHRRWAREFLARAETAPSRNRKLKYLRLAVDNTLRARTIEQEGDTAGGDNPKVGAK
jgi:hypothetical protein